MKIINKNIDGGKPFDWGLASKEYAKYRDIYPEEFYDKIRNLGFCISPQKILDVGTGTGVLPRNMYKYGADWTGADISAEQILQAQRLSEGMNIDYIVSPCENLDFKDKTFDVITACQCFWYFDPDKTAEKFARMLKKDGRLLILYMAWLPNEDKTARMSEDLILKYSPDWSGAGEYVHEISVDRRYYNYFEPEYHEEFRLNVHFTKESWHGRVKACRAVGASLNKDELYNWEREHLDLLNKNTDEEFDVLHYGAIAILKKKE